MCDRLNIAQPLETLFLAMTADFALTRPMFALLGANVVATGMRTTVGTLAGEVAAPLRPRNFASVALLTTTPLLMMGEPARAARPLRQLLVHLVAGPLAPLRLA